MSKKAVDELNVESVISYRTNAAYTSMSCHAVSLRDVYTMMITLNDSCHSVVGCVGLTPTHRQLLTLPSFVVMAPVLDVTSQREAGKTTN